MIEYLKNKSSTTNIFKMIFGTVFAQIINVIVQPVLSRLFTPDELGIYSLLLSMATIIIPVASMKLEMLIVSEDDDNKAQYITDSCIINCFIVSVLYLIIISIGFFIDYSNVFNKYGGCIFWIPFLVFTNGIRFIFISYNNRYKEYKMISIMGVIRESARAMIQVFSGLMHFSILGLTFGYFIAPLVGIRYQSKKYIEKLKIRKFIDYNKYKNIMVNDAKKQILYLIPAQFINNLSSSMITISIATLFSAEDLGYYSLGIRFLEVPIIFITANVSKVCYREISERLSSDKFLMRFTFSICMVITVISMFGFSLLYILACPLAEIVFGKGYSIAGNYLRIMCSMYAVRMIATSFTGLYTLFNKQRIELIVNIVILLISVTAYFFTGIKQLDILTYLKFVSIGYTIVYSCLLLSYLYLCYKHDNELKKRTAN